MVFQVVPDPLVQLAQSVPPDLEETTVLPDSEPLVKMDLMVHLEPLVKMDIMAHLEQREKLEDPVDLVPLVLEENLEPEDSMELPVPPEKMDSPVALDLKDLLEHLEHQALLDPLDPVLLPSLDFQEPQVAMVNLVPLVPPDSLELKAMLAMLDFPELPVLVEHLANKV